MKKKINIKESNLKNRRSNWSSKEIERIKKIAVPVLKRAGVKRAGIFGSYARGEQTPDSDVDILVDVDGNLLDLVRIQLELKKILGKNVDILSYNGINHLIKRKILKEELKII